MKIVEALERGESFGAGELGGQAFVEGIVENLRDESRGRRRSARRSRPRRPITSSIIAESFRCGSSPAAASCRAPIRVGCPPSRARPSASRRRFDGSTVITAVLRSCGCASERESGGNRGFTDAAGTEQNRNRALGEKFLQSKLTISGRQKISSPRFYPCVIQSRRGEESRLARGRGRIRDSSLRSE